MQDHLSPGSESAVDRSRGIAFLASVHQVAQPIPAERGVPSRPCRHPAAAFALRPPSGDALIEGTPCLPLPLSCGLWPPDGGEPEPLPPSPARLFPGWSPPSGPGGAGGVPPEAPSSSDVDRCRKSFSPQSMLPRLRSRLHHPTAVALPPSRGLLVARQVGLPITSTACRSNASGPLRSDAPKYKRQGRK